MYVQYATPHTRSPLCANPTPATLYKLMASPLRPQSALSFIHYHSLQRKLPQAFLYIVVDTHTRQSCVCSTYYCFDIHLRMANSCTFLGRICTIVVAIFFGLLISSSSIVLSDDPLGNICSDTDANYAANIGGVNGNIITFLTKAAVHAPFPVKEARTSSSSANWTVYGLLQCRGDVSVSDCISCTVDATTQLRARCPNQANARIWYDFCFLRYDIKPFFGQADSGNGVLYWNVNTVSDPSVFERKLKGVMDSARKQALAPSSGGLGRDRVKLSPFINLYGLVQCTGDLSPAECSKCLADAYTNFQSSGSSCKDRQGCRVLYGSCYVRYEIYPFYFPLYAAAPKPPTPQVRKEFLIKKSG